MSNVENKSNIEEIVSLTNLLNDSANKYYNGFEPTLTDVEYDNLLEKLQMKEKEVGVQLPNSPTRRVGFTVLDNIPKRTLDRPMLSLDKIKNDFDALMKRIKGKQSILMLKLDGLSCQLKYEDGKLVSASTRGNGVEGSDVTEMVKTLPSVPNQLKNNFTGLIIGEIIIRKHNFDIINQKRVIDGLEEYANIRNLATGTLLSLDTKLGRERCLELVAFDMTGYNDEIVTTQDFILDEIDGLGFQTPYYDIYAGLEPKTVVEGYITSLKAQANEAGIPIDGIVIGLNNLEARSKCKPTDKYPTHSVAFKFEDEYEITRIVDIETNVSRTGILTPVAIVEPVILDGTEVSRASLHNVSILRAHEIGIGDEVKIVKANQIIPQIIENLTKSDTYELPKECPHCGSTLSLDCSEEGVLTLRCGNEYCSEQQVLKMVHLLSKEALNAKGVSEKIIRKLINLGEISNVFDLLDLPNKREHLIKANYPSFGRKSVNNICDAIQNSCNTTLDRLLIGLGIDDVGKKVAKDICKKFNTVDKLLNVTEKELRTINGIDSTAKSISRDITNSKQYICDLLRFIAVEVQEEKESNGNALEGMTFVFTGKTSEFKNRKEVEEFIVANGGKMSGSVSKKTSYLICNAVETSSKYVKATELGIEIITDKKLKEMVI